MAVLGALVWSVVVGAGPPVTNFVILPTRVTLVDANARQQLIVSASVNGYQRDVTRQVVFTSRDPTIVVIDEAGVIRPTGQGETVVRAAGWGNAAEVLVKVGNRTDRPPVSFVNQVMAVLGKAGCNAGSCHGHSKGKGDFKLSLRGYDPSADHRAITDADSGRVVSQRPADSPFLQMPTGQLDHGGGKRFEVNSERYRTLRQWLVEGARSDVGQAVALTRIEVLPESRCVPINAVAPGDIPIDATVGVRTPVQPQQQLIVLAHFADGSVRDVTRQAIYELSDEGVLSVDQRGRVTCVSEGEAAVFVRFLGQMGLARFSILRQKPDFEWREPPSNNYVDEHMATKWKQMQLHPAELSSDAEFLRRVSFDTVGLPPDPSEVRAFLTDPGTDKRKRKIDELLSREGFGDQWALYWAELSGTTESGDSARFKGMWTFSFWLRDTFNRNVPYDQFVRAVVAGKGSSIHNPAMTFITNQLPRVETTAQLFLGIRMRCARCHDHPFDVWKQQDYQALQKFFIRQGYKEGPSDPYGRDIFRFVPPEKHLPWLRDQKITLRLPDASQVEVLGTRDPREIFVEWLFGAAKRRTSRAIVNRVWGRLFGRGIVEPVDDMRFSNPSVNEPLLNALAEDFIENKYDFKYLVRTILHSRTYQLSSRVNESNRNDRANFSHSYLRQLRAEVLLDAIVRVTGRDENFRVAAPGVRAVNLPVTDIQSRFLTLFGRPSERQSACECVRSQTTTLPQVMHLICGETVIEKIRAVDGTLANLLASHPDDGRFIEELYLRVLGRFPQPPERQTAERFLAAADDRTQGGEDMMWALLTSTEFVFNH